MSTAIQKYATDHIEFLDSILLTEVYLLSRLHQSVERVQNHGSNSLHWLGLAISY
jgi:hypothetical protein